MNGQNWNLPAGVTQKDISREDEEPEPCEECDGKGRFLVGESGDGEELYYDDCPVCGGKGYVEY